MRYIVTKKKECQLDRNEFERIRQNANERKGLYCGENPQIKENMDKHLASLEHVRNWPENQITAKDKAKERILQDIQESMRHAEKYTREKETERLEAINTALNLINFRKEPFNDFHRSLRNAKIIQERNRQIEFNQLKKKLLLNQKSLPNNEMDSFYQNREREIEERKKKLGTGIEAVKNDWKQQVFIKQLDRQQLRDVKEEERLLSDKIRDDFKRDECDRKKKMRSDAEKLNLDNRQLVYQKNLINLQHKIMDDEMNRENEIFYKGKNNIHVKLSEQRVKKLKNVDSEIINIPLKDVINIKGHEKTEKARAYMKNGDAFNNPEMDSHFDFYNNYSIDQLENAKLHAKVARLRKKKEIEEFSKLFEEKEKCYQAADRREKALALKRQIEYREFLLRQQEEQRQQPDDKVYIWQMEQDKKVMKYLKEYIKMVLKSQDPTGELRKMYPLKKYLDSIRSVSSEKK